jgi:hypothetical protein
LSHQQPISEGTQSLAQTARLILWGRNTRRINGERVGLDIPIRVTLKTQSQSVARTADFDAKDRS